MTGATVVGPKNIQYKVLEPLGSGSFGTVFKAQPAGGGDLVALKTIQTPFGDEKVLKAFINEGKLALGIQHPNVIRYIYFHDGQTHAGLAPYILMEYADGGTLQDKLREAERQKKFFSNVEIVAMARQLVAGMKMINAELVHRDIKPDNILISEGVLKISDFGLSKVVVEATRHSTFKGFGCIAYMAPEGWRFERNTPQLDIYAMGMVLFQLATLQHPFVLATTDPQKWMEAHLYQPVPNPRTINSSLSSQLAQTILRMVEKDSSKRFSDWSAVEQLLKKDPDAAPPSNRIVSAMLQRRLEQDSAAQAAEAEARRKRDEREQFCRLAKSQIEQDVIEPLRRLVNEFNAEYAGTKASLTGGSLTEKQLRYDIRFPSGRHVSLECRVCLEEDFVREITDTDIFGEHVRRQKLMLPILKERRVIAWTVLKGSDGRGFNIALVERRGEVYGEFLALINKMGWPANVQRRPEPFPFEFDEFEKEVQLIGALHIYSTNVQSFDAEFVRQFVAEYV